LPLAPAAPAAVVFWFPFVPGVPAAAFWFAVPGVAVAPDPAGELPGVPLLPAATPVVPVAPVVPVPLVAAVPGVGPGSGGGGTTPPEMTGTHGVVVRGAVGVVG